MFFFHVVNNVVAAVATELTDIQHRDRRWIARHEIRSFEHAQEIAQQANALEHSEPVEFIATDSGEYCWPRYDVVRAPKVGEQVSKALNGDYYPDGEIVRVSGKNHRIVTTSTGRKYYRRRLSGSWVANKHWSMVRGHISRLNPEF